MTNTPRGLSLLPATLPLFQPLVHTPHTPHLGEVRVHTTRNIAPGLDQLPVHPGRVGIASVPPVLLRQSLVNKHLDKGKARAHSS